jgi:hypothetical protein
MPVSFVDPSLYVPVLIVVALIAALAYVTAKKFK